MSLGEKTARGYEEPFAVQFSVFLANRVGQLREMVDTFVSEDLQILGMSIVDSTDWAVIRIVLSDPDKAKELLKKHALPFTENEVLLIEIPADDDLSQLASCLLQAEINVHFAYPLSVRAHFHPVMVFHVDDEVMARRTLATHGFVLLGNEDLTDQD